MEVTGMGRESVNLIHLRQDRDWWVSSCDHGNELSGPIKARELFV
jgi:hypothetical protein